MDYKRANEIAKKVIEGGKNKITDEEKAFAGKVFKELNGHPFRSCTNCWNDLYILTAIKLKQITENKISPMAQFKLKANKLIQMHGMDPIGQANMTDEKAIKILSISKGHIKNFDEYPANWEELVYAYKNGNLEQVSKSKEDNSSIELINPTKEHEDLRVTSELKSTYKEKLLSLSKRELKEICEEKKLPEKEYEKLGKDKLVEYILARI